MHRLYLSPPHMSGREIEFINEAFASNFIAPIGPMVDAFEMEMCDYTGSPYAAPVFIDSEELSWNMEPELLEKAVKDRINKGKRPKAAIVVHLSGLVFWIPYGLTKPAKPE